MVFFLTLLVMHNQSENFWHPSEKPLFFLGWPFLQPSLKPRLERLVCCFYKSFSLLVVRCLLEDVAKIPGAQQILIDLCRESVLWAEKEQRTYLRLHLQTKLAAALFQTEQYEESLQLVRGLLKEVKKLDDKQLLSSIFLLESKIHHALHHLPRSRVCFESIRRFIT